MSGSRAILLRLSVQDADVVRTQLTQMGEQGERALQRLDAAARAATGGPGSSGGGFGGMRNAIGQAGFQLQDFAVQVQGGTSALTALSQQGSQLLGIFGPTGAIAGAALTVGILATQLFSVGDAAKQGEDAIKAFTKALDDAAKEADRLATLVDRVRGRFLSAAEAARVTTTRAITSDIAQLDRENVAMLQRIGERGLAISEARAELAELERVSALAQSGSAGSVPLDRRSTEAINRRGAELRGEIQSAERDIANLNRQIQNFDALRTRSEGLLAGLAADSSNANPGTFTPPSRRGGGGRLNDTGWQQTIQAMREQREWELGRTKEGLEDVGNETKRLNNYTRELGLTFNSAFEDAIVRGRSLREVLGGIASDLAKMVIRQTITTPLANAVGNIFGATAGNGREAGAGGFLGDMIGGLLGGGFKADGGPVDPSRWYVVGERGPEIFVPNAAGNIVPNHAMGGGVTQNIVIHAQGAGPREIDALRMQIPAIARAAVEDAARRGGASARNIRGR